MLFEITNPSDQYSMEADSFAAALGAVAILGQGRYGLKVIEAPENTPNVYPILFGDWPQSVYEFAGLKNAEDLVIWIDANDERIARALDSVRIGVGRERLTKDEHDAHRSSMNDIGRYAWSYAEALRGKRKFAPIDAVARKR